MKYLIENSDFEQEPIGGGNENVFRLSFFHNF